MQATSDLDTEVKSRQRAVEAAARSDAERSRLQRARDEAASALRVGLLHCATADVYQPIDQLAAGFSSFGAYVRASCSDGGNRKIVASKTSVCIVTCCATK